MKNLLAHTIIGIMVAAVAVLVFLLALHWAPPEVRAARALEEINAKLK